MTEKIGFIGIGNMGNPMAHQLIKAGKDVTVFDISDKAIILAKKNNFNIAKSIDDTIKDASVVITMLPEGKHSREIYLGNEGIVDKVSNKCLLIDCSTIDVKTSQEIGNACDIKQIKMIDAPVTGGVMGAAQARLNFIVGGTDESFNMAKPFLEIMGKKLFHAGGQGSGNGVKICNNMSLGINMIAASESLMLARRLGLNLKKTHEIMKEASGNSAALSIYTPIPNLTDGVPSNNYYKAGFSVAMMKKDLALANEASKSVHANTPLGCSAYEIFNKFCEQGHSTNDFSSISKEIGGEVWDYPISLINSSD